MPSELETGQGIAGQKRPRARSRAVTPGGTCGRTAAAYRATAADAIASLASTDPCTEQSPMMRWDFLNVLCQQWQRYDQHHRAVMLVAAYSDMYRDT